VFLFSKTSRPALRPTRPYIERISGAVSLGVKRLGREGDQSLPSGAQVKNEWSYNASPSYTFMLRTGTTIPFPSYIIIYIKSNIIFILMNTLMA
jgi:hypothetical protein